MDNTLLRTVAWQQANLIVLHTGLAIGNKRDLERTQGSILFELLPPLETLSDL